LKPTSWRGLPIHWYSRLVSGWIVGGMTQSFLMPHLGDRRRPWQGGRSIVSGFVSGSLGCSSAKIRHNRTGQRVARGQKARCSSISLGLAHARTALSKAAAPAWWVLPPADQIELASIRIVTESGRACSLAELEGLADSKTNLATVRNGRPSWSRPARPNEPRARPSASSARHRPATARHWPVLQP
jgi:hypothetical protein